MGPLKYANLDLFEHDDNEVIHGEVSRHPIGVVFILLVVAMLEGIFGTLMFMLIRNQDSIKDSLGISIDTDISSAVGLFFGVVMFFTLVGGAMAVYVYRRNYIVLTDQKIVLALTKNIIRRKISQLSIGDIQDISVFQRTLLSRLFKYGTIRIETAGEQLNLDFPYAPDPYNCTKEIVAAHEKNLQLYGN